MPKPTAVPTWATDVNYPAGAQSFSATPTKVAPSSGKQAGGLEPKEKPAAQYLNHILNLNGQWAAWLNALVGNGSTNSIVQIASNGDLLNSNTLTQLVTFGAGLVVPTGQDIELQGTAKINHADKWRSWSADGGSFSGGGTLSTTTTNNKIVRTFSDSTGVLHKPLDGLKPGDRIKAVYIMYTSPGGAPTVFLFPNDSYINDASLSTTLGATETSASAIKVSEYIVDSPLALDNRALAATLAGKFIGRHMLCKVTASSSGVALYGIAVRYDSIDEPTV